MIDWNPILSFVWWSILAVFMIRTLIVMQRSVKRSSKEFESMEVFNKAVQHCWAQYDELKEQHEKTKERLKLLEQKFQNIQFHGGEA